MWKSLVVFKQMEGAVPSTGEASLSNGNRHHLRSFYPKELLRCTPSIVSHT
jgi:hypothetical protein